MHLLFATPQPLLADTIVMVAARDGFDVLVAIAAGAIAIAVLGVLCLLLFGFMQVRRAGEAVEKAGQRILDAPAVASLRRAATNLEQISETAAKEAARLHASVALLSDRLTQVSDRMEERIEEFNALMEVVQAEAEEVFVDTASTARGVKRGFAHLSGDTEDAQKVAEPATMSPPADFHPDDQLIE